MAVIGVIPARYGSTRLPAKSLVLISGKPLIVRVVENALLAKRLDFLLVATDDRRIADAVGGLDVKAVMTRDDHISGTDRVAEAVESFDCDVVINIQGDEPLIDPGVIDRLAEIMVGDSKWDMATAAAVVEGAELDNPSVVKVVCDSEGRALYFSRSRIPFKRDKDDDECGTIYRRHIGIYAYRRNFLMRLVQEPPCMLELTEKLEQLRALHIGARIKVLDVDKWGPGVDTPEDIALVEREILKKEGGTQ